MWRGALTVAVETDQDAGRRAGGGPQQIAAVHRGFDEVDLNVAHGALFNHAFEASAAGSTAQRRRQP